MPSVSDFSTFSIKLQWIPFLNAQSGHPRSLFLRLWHFNSKCSRISNLHFSEHLFPTFQFLEKFRKHFFLSKFTAHCTSTGLMSIKYHQASKGNSPAEISLLPGKRYRSVMMAPRFAPPCRHIACNVQPEIGLMAHGHAIAIYTEIYYLAATNSQQVQCHDKSERIVIKNNWYFKIYLLIFFLFFFQIIMNLYWRCPKT